MISKFKIRNLKFDFFKFYKSVWLIISKTEHLYIDNFLKNLIIKFFKIII